jgi:predicted 3-demethylubiquinone-9 3-methyltransferase (glyoxalase superfamily)
MTKGNKIKTFLWFENQAEEAAKFYTSVFKGARIGAIARFPEGSPRPAGMVMTVEFRVAGHDFVALNGGPEFKFNESVSFAIECETQKEIDYYWDKLLAGGGNPSQCGWLKDKYGVSWQVYPPMLDKIFAGKDKAKAERVMKAMLGMVKIDIAALKAAAK